MAELERDQMERFLSGTVKLWNLNQAGNCVVGRYFRMTAAQFTTWKDEAWMETILDGAVTQTPEDLKAICQV